MTRPRRGRRPRLAVLWDPPDEEWLSMDLSAELLTATLQKTLADEVEAVRFQPAGVRLVRRTHLGSPATQLNGDRVLTRFLKYPALLVGARRRFDFFHVVDHSYAQLVHVLPRARTGVYLHDLFGFESVLEPNRAPRPAWFRAMMEVVLNGLRKAAVVFTSTELMAARIRGLGLVDSGNVVHAPFGISPEFLAADQRHFPAAVGTELAGRPFVLHVGSNVARKRLDVLFDVFAELRRHEPELMLVQQGARLSHEQSAHVARLDLSRSLVQPPKMNRKELAALYQLARLTLVPSDNEGLGFPVLEAIASGSRVVASDLPTIREAAGDAVSYCPPGDVPAWVAMTRSMLSNPELGPSPAQRAAQAAKFTWERHAQIVWKAYSELGHARQAS